MAAQLEAEAKAPAEAEKAAEDESRRLAAELEAAARAEAELAVPEGALSDSAIARTLQEEEEAEWAASRLKQNEADAVAAAELQVPSIYSLSL